MDEIYEGNLLVSCKFRRPYTTFNAIDSDVVSNISRFREGGAHPRMGRTYAHGQRRRTHAAGVPGTNTVKECP